MSRCRYIYRYVFVWQGKVRGGSLLTYRWPAKLVSQHGFKGSDYATLNKDVVTHMGKREEMGNDQALPVSWLGLGKALACQRKWLEWRDLLRPCWCP